MKRHLKIEKRPSPNEAYRHENKSNILLFLALNEKTSYSVYRIYFCMHYVAIYLEKNCYKFVFVKLH